MVNRLLELDGIDDVTQFTVLGNLGLKLQSIAGFVGTVDHHDPLGGGDKTMITSAALGFDINVAGKLFHYSPLLLRR